MIITEREVKRIVSNYFRDKYKMNIDPKDMSWYYEDGEIIDGLDIGGIVDEED